ncbi:hypothetical protein [Microbacterium sp. SORGH_AS_0421]|uniref:hypothetical protein n=1 Tax=Microbacterium sp. SORGH_AS_0421 TaxID=3041768 RepID=UPI0027D7F730|nr:hypothetical protein [Microbacterium sp. SORGH_AS_0421]
MPTAVAVLPRLVTVLTRHVSARGVDDLRPAVALQTDAHLAPWRRCVRGLAPLDGSDGIVHGVIFGAGETRPRDHRDDEDHDRQQKAPAIPERTQEPRGAS